MLLLHVAVVTVSLYTALEGTTVEPIYLGVSSTANVCAVERQYYRLVLLPPPALEAYVILVLWTSYNKKCLEVQQATLMGAEFTVQLILNY